MSYNEMSLVHVAQEPTVPAVSKPPLLVLLHGVGSNEHDLMGLAPFLDGRFLIVSLRAPLTIGPDAYGWYNLEWTGDGIKHDQDGAIAGQAAAERAIDELVAAYDADADRVYLAGFSQGAIISLGIALIHPEKIAGAVIMSGRLLPSVAANAAEPERLTGLPLLVVHGTLDNVLPIENGRAIDEYVKRTPINLTYREYPMSHTISQESLAEIAAWLTARIDS